MKKKLTSLALALALLGSSTIPAFAATTCSDVKGSWCESYVNDLISKNIVSGYSDGTYKPENPVTRGAIAKMVVTTMQSCGSTIKPTTTGTKMAGTTWSSEYVTPLVDNGIISKSDYSKGYKESVAMTRLETVKALVKTYLHANVNEQLPTDATLTFADADQISTADAPYVKMGVDLGIINGYTNADGKTMFGPNGNIKRSTAAAMIDRFIEIVGEIHDHISEQSANMGQISTDVSSVPQIQNVEWVIKPTIGNVTMVKPFSKVSEDGLAIYYQGDYVNPVAVDLSGKTYSFTGIGMMRDFVHGVAPAMSTATNHWGYVNLAGEWICKPVLDSADDFSKSYKKDGTEFYCGFGEYKQTECFILSDGTVHTEDWPYMTYQEELAYTGTTEVDPPVVDGDTAIGPTDGGLYTFAKLLSTENESNSHTVYGICDQNGKVIVAPSSTGLHGQYDSALVTSSCILLNHQVGATLGADITDIYDGSTGKLLYSCTCVKELASLYNVPYMELLLDSSLEGQGLLQCSNGEKKGFIKPDGTNVIPCVFDNVTSFANGYAWVKYNGLWGCIKLPNF